MSHIHSIYDTDPHFTIDATTREITNRSEKITVMQYDHNAERFTFEISRFNGLDGHDMSLCNKVRVHFNNVKADRTATSEDAYTVKDLQISPDSEDVVIFSWLIEQNATMYNGTLNFVVVFECIADDGTVDYRWGSDKYTGISVGESINNGEAIVKEYSDVLAEWEARINAHEAAVADQIGDINTAIDELNAVLATLSNGGDA